MLPAAANTGLGEVRRGAHFGPVAASPTWDGADILIESVTHEINTC